MSTHDTIEAAFDSLSDTIESYAAACRLNGNRAGYSRACADILNELLDVRARAISWVEDIDGEYVGDPPRCSVTVHYNVRISGGDLSALLDVLGVVVPWNETPGAVLDRLVVARRERAIAAAAAATRAELDREAAEEELPGGDT